MAESVYAENYRLALQGEALAAAVYDGLGYVIVDQRVRTKCGEIDIIARGPDETVVFIEVKTRRGRAFGAAEAVTAKKLRTMRRCAAEWLAGKPYAAVRFDVAEVLDLGEEMQVRIYEDVEDGAC